MNVDSPLLVALVVISVLTGAASGGVYLAFSAMVLPALRTGDASEAVRVMQRVNVAAMRPAFMLVFFGAGLAGIGLVIAEAMLTGAVSPLRGVGAALLDASVLLTILVNVPRNNALAAADASPASWRAFDRVWSPANAVRGWLSTLGAAAIVGSLFV
ncbi:DUF1772 domain-containing protein [Microbacteriaceae bacterium VKM Ac-2854]|nr:DUF1772 domain-containing protein [Microbacteriaceae bacterium VKM Ac-2854]